MKYDYYSNLPSAKIKRLGVGSLSDVELISLAIGSGCKGYDFNAISKALNALILKRGIDCVTLDDIKSVKGIGDSKAASIMAMIEFCKRSFVKPFVSLFLLLT